MEIIKHSTTQKGFSEKVANSIASDIRNSSSIIYDNKWKCFTKWLRKKGIKDPLQTNITNIAEFLNYLFEDKGLEVSTINGYKAAISKVLQLVTKLDISNNPYIKALISNFANERPIHSKVYPSWDLTIVLNALKKSQYEPLQNATLFNLTKKTIFLLLFAPGARRSDIHALDINNVLFSNYSNSCWFGPNHNFKLRTLMLRQVLVNL